ncbi:armadillo-type protein [Entophlyctis helioformis]|nr:armadillo-type protein [Entophlyctis helioformis]
MTADEQATSRIVSILFTLGEQVSLKAGIEADLPRLEKEFLVNKDLFLEAFRICLTQLPTKSGVFATLTGLLNVRNAEIAKAIVDHATSILNQALQQSHLRTVKLVFRFFAECVSANVILPLQLMDLLDTLLSVTLEPDVRQERSDAFVFIVLATLPWAAAQLRERAPEHLERIITGMSSYFAIRKSRESITGLATAMDAMTMYRSTSDDPYRQVDKLELLWTQVQGMRATNWDARILVRPHELFETTLSQGLQHELPPVSVPSSLTSVKFNYQPKVWIFDDSLLSGERQVGHLPQTTDIARFILDDVATDIVRVFQLNHTEATALLLRLDTHFDLDYLADNGYIVNETVIEVIFAELLRLPKSQERFVYYATLIIDLCKERRDTVPSILGRCIRTLFSRLDSPAGLGYGMDVEGIRRLSDWFAQHLSNFGYVWKWTEWEHVLEADPNSAQFVFVRETLERCIRLSYWDRIKGVIPEVFEKHEGIFPAAPPSFSFKYESAETAGDDGLFRLVAPLSKAITQRADAEHVEDLLAKLQQYVAGQTIDIDGEPMTIDMASAEPETIAREALMQCIMLQGSKSFSHILNVMERYLPLLQKWNATSEARIHTIQIAADFWANNSQFIEIILDKLTNYRIVDPKSILNWICQPAVLDPRFSRFFLWTIVRNTLIKVNLKVAQISAKLEAAKLEAKSFSEMTGITVPTLDAAFEAAQRDKKETFITFFQKYVEIAGAKVVHFEQQGLDPTTTPWWRWVVGFFREVTRAFKDDVEQVKFTVDAVVFTPDIDPRVSQLWTEFKAASELHQDDVA